MPTSSAAPGQVWACRQDRRLAYVLAVDSSFACMARAPLRDHMAPRVTHVRLDHHGGIQRYRYIETPDERPTWAQGVEARER